MVSKTKEREIGANPSWTDLGLPAIDRSAVLPRVGERKYPTVLEWGSAEFRQFALESTLNSSTENTPNIPGAWAYALAHVFPAHLVLNYSDAQIEELETALSRPFLSYPALAPGEKITPLIHHSFDSLRKKYPNLDPKQVTDRLAIVLGLMKHLAARNMTRKAHPHLSEDENVYFSEWVGGKMIDLQGKIMTKSEARKAIKALFPNAGTMLQDQILNQFTFHEKELAHGKNGVPLLFLQEQMFEFPSGRRLLVRMKGHRGPKDCELNDNCGAQGSDIYELIDPDSHTNAQIIVGELSIHYLNSGFPQGTHQAFHSNIVDVADILDFEGSEAVSFPSLTYESTYHRYQATIAYNKDRTVILPGKIRDRATDLNPLVVGLWRILFPQKK